MSSACIIVERSSASGGRGRFSKMGVSTSPGMIAHARTPSCDSSVFMPRIMLSEAAFAALYGAPPHESRADSGH